MQLILGAGITRIVLEVVNSILSIRQCINLLMILISSPTLTGHSARVTIKTIPGNNFRRVPKGSKKIQKCKTEAADMTLTHTVLDYILPARYLKVVISTFCSAFITLSLKSSIMHLANVLEEWITDILMSWYVHVLQYVPLVPKKCHLQQAKIMNEVPKMLHSAGKGLRISLQIATGVAVSSHPAVVQIHIAVSNPVRR